MESKAESRPWSGHGSLLTQEIKKGYTSPVRRSHQRRTLLIRIIKKEY